MSELKMNLYEINKAAMENEPPMDVISFNRKTNEVAKDMLNHKYLMLLCNDRKDYTVFNLLNANQKKLNKDLIECLKNRGIVLSIDKQKDGNYEIWIKDKKKSNIYCYYLFNYSFGVIEYNE